MIGVSVRTICRRMSDFGLCVRAQYSTMSDAELEEWFVIFSPHFPCVEIGKCKATHLLCRGHRVQQIHIRESQIQKEPSLDIYMF